MFDLIRDSIAEIAGRDLERLNQRFEQEVIREYEYITPVGVKILTLRKWAEYVRYN